MLLGQEIGQEWLGQGREGASGEMWTLDYYL